MAKRKNNIKKSWIQLGAGISIGALGFLILLNFLGNNWFASTHTCTMMSTPLWQRSGFWVFFILISLVSLVFLYLLINKTKS